MTTRKDLQNWLNRFPEDTIIEIAINKKSNDYETYGRIVFETPKLEDDYIGNGWEFTDFRDNKFVHPEAEHFNKCYLRLGETY